jgi:acetoin utilization protein AcuB
MQVREWMSPDPVTVTPQTTVADARTLLSEHGFRHLPVVDGGVLVGIVSDRDVAINPRALRAAVRSHTVGDLVDDDRTVEAVMSRDPHVVDAEATLDAAARLLVSRQISALPVIDDGRALIGIITSVDCLLATLQPTG